MHPAVAMKAGRLREGKYDPSRTFGIDRFMVPTRVSQRRSRPVALGQAALGVALALGHAGELGDLGFHDRLGEDADALAQEGRHRPRQSPCAPSRARPSCPRPSWCSSVSWVLSPATRGRRGGRFRSRPTRCNAKSGDMTNRLCLKCREMPLTSAPTLTVENERGGAAFCRIASSRDERHGGRQ